MNPLQVQNKLALSADEDFILTAWQYRMMQRDVAASAGKHLPTKREVRNAFRAAAVEPILERTDPAWSPAVATAVAALAGDEDGPDLEALEDAAVELSPAVKKRSRALLLLIDLYGGCVGRRSRGGCCSVWCNGPETGTRRRSLRPSQQRWWGSSARRCRIRPWPMGVRNHGRAVTRGTTSTTAHVGSAA